ncbi:hypothetical protein CYLTODRAFT_327312, partial [Cylindrobasidium torrendii FP15055 ss-10]
DGRLPFREMAPTRQHMLSDTRFSHATAVDALGVIRSLVINQGLTFNTAKCQDHSPWFASEADWYTFRGSGEGGDKAQYVNKLAYGRTNGRSSSNFGTLWTQSKALYDELRKQEHGRAPFQYVLGLLRRRCHIKTFGDLTSLLLAEDMVYAGLVAKPTLDEFAIVVGKLRKGAAKALMSLGLVSAKASTQEIAVAFVKVYNSVNNSLTQDEKDLMRFDMFMVEHALCKMQKCKR